MRHRLKISTLLASIGLSCQPASEEAAPLLVIVDHENVDATPFEIEPETALKSVTTTPTRLVLAVRPEQLSGSLSVRLPNACPVVVKLDRTKPGEARRVQARPYLDLGPNRPELGFDARFEIEAKPGCPEAARGTVSWRQLEGAPLKEVRSERRGFSYSARTQKHQELVPAPPKGRIVPISPASSGHVLLEATLKLPDGSASRARISLAAVSRARGLPNVPVNASVLLGGEGWTLLDKPPGASTRLASDDGLTWFRPRVSGRWLLTDGNGHELSVQSALYSAMPLDCARADCHQDRGFGTAGAMGSVMSRALAGHLGPLYDPTCALGCHAVGEPGLDDGGFDDVAQQMDFHLSAHTLPAELPPQLERLSNVGCLACHGPGTIPEPSARWSILSAAVCAYCHDQPPRYDHVQSWKKSGMSRADHDPAARSSPECMKCHTTWGFLTAANTNETSRQPPADVVLGVSCPACHDVHQSPATAGLVRRRKPPAAASTLPAAALEASGVCLHCHAPSRPGPGADEFPWASVTAIFAGTGGFDRSGRSLSGRGPHAALPRGCLTCHGDNHDFFVRPNRCGECHEPAMRDGSLQRHAQALWSRLVQRGAVKPLGAAGTHMELGFSAPTRIEKLAAYNISLVLLDSAADVHNPSYATLLLEEASHMLSKPKTGVLP